jgi:predicted RNA-binding protein associated with RNAse of E/G family
LHFIVVDLGEVDVMENITSTQRNNLKQGCLVPVLSLWMIKIHAHRKKNVIIQMVHHSDEVIKVNFLFT